MRIRVAPAFWRAWVVVGLLVSGLGLADVLAADLKIEAQLVWGTADAKSPNPQHKPVEADILKKLRELPLKWSHYFEVTRKQVALPAKATRKFELGRCDIEITSLGGLDVEVTLLATGGKKIVKRTQAFPKGEILVLGGNAPNSTAWLAILKRID